MLGRCSIRSLRCRALVVVGAICFAATWAIYTTTTFRPQTRPTAKFLCSSCPDERGLNGRISATVETFASAGQGYGSSSEAGAERCKDTTVVMLIPFRDRHPQLSTFSAHMAKFIASHCARRWLLYLIEQDDHTYFNKGFLINAGLHLLRSEEPDLFADSSNVCIVQHDIDFLPSDEVDYTWCHKPIQLSSEIECSASVYKAKASYSLPYMYNAGGVISMQATHWLAINGFSNRFIGWGGEDDDLFNRLRQTGLLFGGCGPFCGAGNRDWHGHAWLDSETGHARTIARPPIGGGRFSCQEHERGISQHITGPEPEPEPELSAISSNSDTAATTAVSQQAPAKPHDHNATVQALYFLQDTIRRYMEGCLGSPECSSFWRIADGLNTVNFTVSGYTRRSAVLPLAAGASGGDTGTGADYLQDVRHELRWAKVRGVNTGKEDAGHQSSLASWVASHEAERQARRKKQYGVRISAAVHDVFRYYAGLKPLAQPKQSHPE